MHAFFYTKPAQRPSLWNAAAPRCPRTAVARPSRLMQMTVETASLTALRQTVTLVCGDALEFMRIEACEHGARMKVWLCVAESLVAQVMEAVMRLLPSAEFGRCVAHDTKRPAKVAS